MNLIIVMFVFSWWQFSTFNVNDGSTVISNANVSGSVYDIDNFSLMKPWFLEYVLVNTNWLKFVHLI